MANEKSYEMNQGISRRVKQYIILFLVLDLILIWGEKIINYVLDNTNVQLSSLIISTVLLLIPSIALLVIDFVQDIKLHESMDKRIFKVREKTMKIITTEMVKAGTQIHAIGIDKLSSDEKEVRNIFYHFVNEQDILRALSFTYWEQYFVNMYAVLFGLLSFFFAALHVIIGKHFGYSLAIPIVQLLVTVSIILSTKFSLVHKIYLLPEQQINEIRHTKPVELKKEIESRFRNPIL